MGTCFNPESFGNQGPKKRLAVRNVTSRTVSPFEDGSHPISMKAMGWEKTITGRRESIAREPLSGWNLLEAGSVYHQSSRASRGFQSRGEIFPRRSISEGTSNRVPPQHCDE
jgi:hypothetical protein